MKRILTSALAIVLFIGAANAQSENRQKPGDRKEHRQMALKGIELTAQQQTQVKTINQNYRAQLDVLRAQKLTAEEARTKRENLRKQHASDLRALLTPDQKAKLDRARTQRSDANRSKVRAEKKDGRNEKGAARLKSKKQGKELNLTADQKTKMKTLNQSYKAKFDALRNDGTQSKEVKKSQIKDLKKERQESVRAILTPEQQSKIQDHRKRSKAVTK